MRRSSGVYYSTVSPPEILRVSKDGSPAAEIATTSSAPVAIAVDDAWVYWGTKGGEVHRLPKK